MGIMDSISSSSSGNQLGGIGYILTTRQYGTVESGRSMPLASAPFDSALQSRRLAEPFVISSLLALCFNRKFRQKIQ